MAEITNEVENMNDADCPEESVYVLMTENHRVSRSRRAKWFITHLSQSLNSLEDDTEEEMTVLTTPLSPPNLIKSNVYYISHQYSLVFVLDMSTTMLQVSNETYSIKLDEAVKALITLLEQLKNPMVIPGTGKEFCPQLCVSVLAYCKSNNPQKRCKVLVQGADLNTENIEDVIQIVKQGILKLENKRASGVDNEQKCQKQQNPLDPDQTRADNCLEKMIKAGHLGVLLLPRGAMKGIIILTDGIGGFTTPSSKHNTVNQLRTSNISCWVVLCGGGSCPSLSLGSVPDTQAIEFLTEACNGSVIDPAKLLNTAAATDAPPGINPAQKCVLFWSFQVSSWKERRRSLSSLGFCEHLTDPFVPQSVYTQNRTTITLPLTSLIGCRTREGFFIQSATVKDSLLEIILTYPWQSNVSINYSIRTPWPVTMTSCTLLVTVSFVAPYPFVRDFQSDIRQFTGPHATALKRFKQTLKSLTHSDTFLSHSVAFSANSQFYTLPSSLKKGTPLFHNPNPNQSKPVPSVSTQGITDKSLPVLCKYWIPLASLDIAIWSKWMHTEKIVLVLNQDSALPPHLLHPSSSGRYSTLQCRVAALKLFNCLRSWCSLVLLESQLFLKFIPDDANPNHFCAVRVAQLQPCVLVHVGFIEGTPHKLQNNTVAELMATIESLAISLPLKESRVPLKTKKAKPPQQPCTTMIHKQLQKALISYDILREATAEVPPVQLEYLDRFEWQWDVPHCNPDLLMGLLQQRLREGFLIASASNGVVTLVAQISVKQPYSALTLPSLIQYVIHPFNRLTRKFLTEVWVEPQYQFISDTPTGLEYLRDEKTADIPYKVHSKDMAILTQITTFLDYSPKPDDTPPTSLPTSSLPSDPGASLLGIKYNQEIHSDLSSLYSRSHVTTIAFSAFTEHNASSYTPLTLADCSLLNSQLNRKFLDLFQERLSTKALLVKDSAKLIQRLHDSDHLNDFFTLYLADSTSSHPLWKCFIVDDPDGLALVFTPCFICCSPSDTPTDGRDTPTDDHGTPPKTFSFPLVLMYTTLPHLLEEDSVLSGLLPLPQDRHFNCLFSSDSSKTNFSRSFNSTLLEKIRHMHLLAYLNALQDGLTFGKQVLLQNDLEMGLSMCSRAEISVDLTPLLLGVCHHCCEAKAETAITLEALATLLETLDQQNQEHAVQFNTNVTTGTQCLQRANDVSVLFREFFADSGLVGIEGLGYYWYRELEHSQSRETSVCSVLIEDDEESNSRFTTPGPIAMGDSRTDEDDSDFDLSNLEPIFTPPTQSTSTRVVHIDHAPLFIRLSTVFTSVGEDQVQTVERLTERGNLSLCLESLFTSISNKPPPTDDHTQWKLTLSIEAFTLLEAHDLADDTRSPGDCMLAIHSCFRPVISSLKAKVEWIVKDELVGRARELFENDERVPPILLPSVTSHVQGSFKRFNNCLMEQQPVRFVLGHTSSAHQFIQLLSTIEIPNMKIHRTENNYFYFTSTTVNTNTPSVSTFQHTTPPRFDKGCGKLRSSTPTILARSSSRQNIPRSHRRSQSLTSVVSSIPSLSSAISNTAPQSITTGQAIPATGRTPTTPRTPRKSVSSIESPTMECHLEEITDSMYDASKSNSVASVLTALSTPTSVTEDKTWIVLRIVPHYVEIYLHSRRSQGLSTEDRAKQSEQCSSVVSAIQAICHKTNQWYLLKDLLDTHLCSPLLLAESSSAAWVEGTSNIIPEITIDGETFSHCEFECQPQWREHITPHWRLKSMGNKIALRITSSALEAFAVSNRQDIYVLQDVMDDGNEAIFYLRISESVCVEESNYGTEAPPTYDDQQQRCETRATVADDDSISNLSYQRSSFDIAETQSQLSRQVSMFSGLDFGAHESVVLELYGIAQPSESMTTRLQRLIRSKLDDKALELMCSLYTRNLKLELTNADIQFLQDYPEKPSEVLSIPIPDWVSYPQALFYYVLQQFSVIFTKPQYNTVEGLYSTLCVPPTVDKVLRDRNLPHSIQQDLLSLYIRPLTRGRGMALISACLVSPEGMVLPPIMDILPPTILPTIPSYDTIRGITPIEQFPVIGDQYTIALHIWERGNVGMDELRRKLVSAVQGGLVDILMETHFLQLPIAGLTDDEITALISPGLMRRASGVSRTTSGSENLSFVDVDINTSKDSPDQTQRDIEEPVKAGLVAIDMGSPDWEQREKLRRQLKCREVLKRDAHMGLKGQMKKEYLEIFSSFLFDAFEIGLPEVFYNKWRVPANFIINTTISQTLSILTSSLASLSASCEMNLTIWRMESTSSHFTFVSRAEFEKSSSSDNKTQENGYHGDKYCYAIVGRDLSQWRESMEPQDCTLRQEQYWPKEQQFLPLSSWKKYNERGVPLNAVAKKHNTFIPRQRMVLGYLVDGMFHLWLYNVIEDRVKEIKARLNNLESWQSKRSGLLYHILSQKMGLFHHTEPRDIAPLTQRAQKYCTNIQSISTLVNNVTPMPSPKSPPSRHAFELNCFYQDLEPSVPIGHTYSDPVERHGRQFHDTFSSHRETLKQSDLLLKVFNTWDSDRRNKADQATPISSEVISKLKQTSRLLHYCSSSIWLLSKYYISSTSLEANSSDQSVFEDVSSWFNSIREMFINEYIAYLQTLHFQSINECPPSRGGATRGHTPSPTNSAMRFYKCLQRSWPGGIILIELTFQEQLFLVKLYSLELSRSSNLPPPSNDVSGLFSLECSRIKDYIHTHSFNYDFHLRNILKIVQGKLKVEGELDLRDLLNEFCRNYANPPHYIRNRICSDRLRIKVSVPSRTLYTHIIGHCSEFSLQRIDVIQTSGDGCGSSLAWDNCLMINLRSSVTGGTTAPELSQILKETKDMYNVIVLALPDVNEGEGPVATEIPLIIYMLLVNKMEMYPRLTANSPLISSFTSRKAVVLTSEAGTVAGTIGGRGSDTREKQSELQDSVMFHRRKLGYGSLCSPSSASEMVFNPYILDELMHGLKVHFENIVKTAQSNVRRDELWKRLLYGGMSAEIPVLSYTEFDELMLLARSEDLEQFDLSLSSLKHQTRIWYKSLIDFLQQRFGDNVKIFNNPLTATIHAVIINEGWHDMLVRVVCDDGQSQGFHCVYRKSQEAGTSFEERRVTANIEAEQLHINMFVNYVCSFVWADIINTTPCLPVSKVRHHTRDKK